MVNFVNKEAILLKEAIVNSEEVKQIKRLEKYIDNNETLKKEFETLKQIQRKMVLAKTNNELIDYKKYKVMYEAQMEKVKEFPFVEEYFELLEEVDLLLVNVTKTIESEINKLLE